MKIQPPPGMRDFYPEDQRLQNWLFGHWRDVSRAFGFQEYEGPIFEFLDLYKLKSGDGIVSELFNFADRGGREFAIRPEMTPTLARMIAAKASTLPRPIKWFSLPRMCRAEKPQRGRLREFFQWNVDVLGVDDPLADAEVIAVAVEFFRRIGLTPEDVTIRISSRPVAAAVLNSLGIPAEKTETAFALIDRQEKLPPEDFAKLWANEFGGVCDTEKLDAALNLARSPEALTELAGRGAESPTAAAVDAFGQLWSNLTALQIAPFCSVNLRTVRGLAYYTGVVFEAHALRGGLRAVLGGGRYDNLTGLLGGGQVPGVGFGMGDAPMIELLRELGRLPELADEIDVFVIDADRELFSEALKIVTRLRQAGLTVDFSYKRQNVGKQLKQAASRGARQVVIVGEELREDPPGVVVKALATGEQETIPAAELERRLSGAGVRPD